MNPDLKKILKDLRRKEANGKSNTGINLNIGDDGLLKVRGDDGYTPVKGVDYWTPEEINSIVEGIFKAAKPTKGVDYYTDADKRSFVAEVLKLATPVKGKDYRDGIDGKDGRDGVDGVSPDARSVAIDAVTLLESFDGDARLSATALRDFEVALDKALKNPDFKIALSTDQITGIKDLLPKYPPMNAGGSGATFLKSLRDVDLSALTKNADGKYILGGGGGSVDDTAYGVSWDGDTTTAASKNAIYDKIETLAGGHDPVTVTDTAEIDLTLTGQNIQAAIVAGSIDETKLDTSVNASLDLADSAQQPPAEGAFVDGDKTKLDGIEALADVTDATNVDAAGATMNTDTDLSANSYFLDEDDFASNDATKVPSQQSVKTYVDTAVASSEGILTYVFSAVNSDISGYESMPSLPSYTAGALTTLPVAVTTTPTLMEEFATDVGFPNTTAIPAGTFTVHFETDKVAGSNNYYCYAEIYKRASGGTETLLTTTDNSTQTAVNTVVQQSVTAVLGTNTTLLSTDRIVVKIYAVMLSSTATINLLYDDTTNSRLELPASHVDATNFVPYTGATNDLDLGTHSVTASNVSGTNTGDQTSIVGITGTKAQFDTAVTDGDFMYIGDAPTAHTHLLAAGATDVTATAAELNHSVGVTSAIQTQLNAKADKIKSVAIQIQDGATALATGDGKAFFSVPAELNGWNLTAVRAGVVTAGTTGTTDFQIHNVTDVVDMLSTKLTIDSADTTSATAATAAVINTANDDVATDDVLRIDVDAVQTTAPLGGFITLTFELP